MQFCLVIISFCFHASVLQLKTALGWEHVASAWSSRGVAGAMTPVIQGEGTALRVPHGDRWDSAEHMAARWPWTPVCAPKKRTMSGLLSNVQVTETPFSSWMHWFFFLFVLLYYFRILVLFSVSSKPRGECGYCALNIHSGFTRPYFESHHWYSLLFKFEVT